MEYVIRNLRERPDSGGLESWSVRLMSEPDYIRSRDLSFFLFYIRENIDSQLLFSPISFFFVTK